MYWWLWVLIAVVAFLIVVAIRDVLQTSHTITRNFPLIGHLRYFLESFGPELRQYIVSDNHEELPFSRDQRRYVYASAKKQNPYFGFGTEANFEQDSYVFLRHSAFPLDDPAQGLELEQLGVLKTLGARHNRAKAFAPNSLVNISAMSYGSLSSTAVEAMNRGSALAGCLHNTGEGGISDYHRKGGELTFQIGTGYFGARNADGTFSIDRLVETVASAEVRCIELKLSQGAKPGLGGVLPGEKVTEEIAAARGVPVGITVHSPNRHATFTDIGGLIHFVEEIATATGLPVGIKSAVGERAFWGELADAMQDTKRGPDFITVDGGEGGTGAAPLVFTDHVALPFRRGFAEVYRAFATRDMHNDMVFVGSGKLGIPANAMVAMAMGVDVLAVGREAMLAIGCIQAQRCHTGRCPTGVATQSAWLTRGLDPADKSVRMANYVTALRAELRRLSHALGADHPSRVDPSVVEIRTGPQVSERVRELYDYDPAWYSSKI